MVLAFKPQFKPKILDGIKIHTMREDTHNRWHPGRDIQMATGVRTKNYNCFNNKDKCISTQKVQIIHERIFDTGDMVGRIFNTILVDDRALSQSEKRLLALQDGFDSYEAFIAFFDRDWEGKLIHWTNFKY